MSEYDELIREMRERLCSRGQAEREWFDAWQDEFDAVAAEGDDDGDGEACALLIDALVAFDCWQGDR